MAYTDGKNSAKAIGLTVRDATKDDTDSVFRVMLESMVDDAVIEYRYPLRHQYPEDYEKYKRAELESYLNQPEKFKVQIVVDKNEPIAFAVWDLAPTIKANEKDTGRATRRDIDPKHFDLFINRLMECIEKYFKQYGDNQLALCLLGTLPSHRRRGAASMLVRWGIENANGRPITLFAGPDGRRVYEHFKFDWIADEYVQADDDEEKLWFSIMEYRA